MNERFLILNEVLKLHLSEHFIKKIYKMSDIHEPWSNDVILLPWVTVGRCGRPCTFRYQERDYTCCSFTIVCLRGQQIFPWKLCFFVFIIDMNSCSKVFFKEIQMKRVCKLCHVCSRQIYVGAESCVVAPEHSAS